MYMRNSRFAKKLPQSNISKHIRELKIAGLVREKQGKICFVFTYFS